VSWQLFRYTVKENHFVLVHDDDLSKDFGFSLRFSAGDCSLVWNKQVVIDFFNKFIGEEPSYLGMRVPPQIANFDGFIATLPENRRKEVVQGPRQDEPNPRDMKD
jgi:hypothetical protein